MSSERGGVGGQPRKFVACAITFFVSLSIENNHAAMRVCIALTHHTGVLAK